jgi:eukaryotic-like serine/threonine-protein kinase
MGEFMHGKLKPGTVVAARYRIVDTLGSGGMSTVYLAEDLKLPGTRWAVKELSQDMLHIDNGTREAQFLMALEHPHLPKIIDYFASDGIRSGLLVMEHIRGRTLQQLFEQQGRRIAPAELLKFMLQLIDALDYLHRQQNQPVVYRDLKPSNVMITVHGQVKLIDFGTARKHKQGHMDDTVKLGTVGFASPEQFRGEQTDPRSDLYSLGAMMYYLLTGGRYYYETRTPIRDIASDLDEGWSQVIDKLLSHHPADRYTTAAEVGSQLLQISDRLMQRREGISSRDGVRFVAGKLILVGSVYTGAGATFTSILLSRALNDYAVPHAVAELPGGPCDLYYWLNGEQNEPRSYTYLTDRIADSTSGAFAASFLEWRNKHTVWLPLPPRSEKADWDSASWLQQLRTARQPVTVIDISNRWEEPEVRELCKQADHLVAVYGADLPRCRRPSSRQVLQQLNDWATSGKEVSYVCNMSADWRGRAEWLESLPSRPIAEIPYVPYEQLLAAAWKGALIQDDTASKKRLIQAIEPLVYRLLPELKGIKRRRFRNMASFFLQRGLSRW